MILGSHNSWSFLKETPWWMIITRPIAKCQDTSIESQFISGVRCFDLRLRWDNKSQLFEVCHGRTIYKSNLVDDLDYLNIKSLLLKQDIYVRVLLEDSGKVKEFVDKKFYNMCDSLQKSYKYIKFFGGWAARKRWRQPIYNFNYNPTVEENHASVKGKWYEKIPFIYSLRHNKDIINKGTNKDILMIDFINE